jgi:hypothetical protein
MSYLDAPSKIDLTGVESSELLDNEHLNQHDRVVFLFAYLKGCLAQDFLHLSIIKKTEK